MSFAEDNIKTGSETVNVEDILANFFLEKFDMKGSDRSESDSKYKKKSKHKKHKSKKHKHKSGRRSDSSERRNSNSMSIGCTSSSEEKDIKRLKKIKSLDVKDPNKINSFLPVSLSTQNAVPSNQNNASASTKNPLPYGPSLELLLTGTEIIEGNFESKKQSISSLDRSSEPSSHQVSSVPASADLKPSSESVSTSKELIENTSKKMECGEEKVTNNVEMTSNNVHCTSKELVSDSKLKVSDVDSAVKQELSEGKGKKFKGKSRSRSRTRSKHRKRSRSRSRSKPRKPSRSRSRSKPRKPSRSRSRSKPRKNSRSRSRSKPRKPSRSRSRSKRKHSRSRSRSKPRKPSRSRSRSKSRKHSRSRSRSKPRKRSRSKSRSSQSRSRRRSRSRSIYRSRKERSLSRDRSKSRHSPRHKTRRSRSRNRSLKSRRSRSRSHQRRRRSRSWSYSKDTKSRHSARRRSRSTSRNRRSRSRSKGSHRSQRESNRRRKSSSERESKSKQKSRSKSKEKHSSSKSCKIDQAKIREIAEKNVLNMIQQGTLPEGISLEHFKKKELVSMKAGGKSVQELTDFCAKLSKKENEVTDDVHDAKDVGNVDGENDFIHHPFKLKEQSVIKLNIKNAVQIPIKTHAEKFAETAKLSSQFPVSSGNQHKQKELEWVPVVPEESKSDLKQNEVKSVVPVESVAAPKTVVKESSLPPLPPVPVSSDIPSIPLPPAPPPLPPLPPSVPPLPIPPVPPFQLLSSSVISDVKAPVTNSTPLQSVSYPPLPVSHGLPVPSSHPDQISSAPFTPKTVSASTSQFDFASVFSKKFQAEQKLQGDPNNAEALKAIQEAEAAIQEWVNSCKVPGMFYGSTHVKPLPRDQLGGFKDYRVKKDQFTRAAPVTEGKGMSLLKKMGWNPGEGLGKNKEGSLVPLIIDIKMDKKGLVSEGESGKNNIANAVKELQGKHPVSALMELCSKRKWKPPLYTIIKDAGPPHKKQFLFKVEVNGVDYQPVIPSSNKKIAKADAAIVCLQALKVFPS